MEELIFQEEITEEPGEKPSEQGEKQQQTHMTPGRNRERATLEGGERSQQCTIPALMTVCFWICAPLSKKEYDRKLTAFNNYSPKRS